MKNIILSHYTIKDIEADPWKETWDTLVDFGEKMAPKLAPMKIKLTIRKIILDEISQKNLMAANMVTIQSPEIKIEETPIEDLMMLELGYAECESCKTPDGVGFSCRTLKDFDGNERMALPEAFFMEATLRVAFKSEHDDGCGSSNCCSCSGGCEDEEQSGSSKD
ncbi:MAG: DUF2703 domain-containing protein [Synergistaceae bacterium]|nr:DUF2703 domain-containing protein [Synergistaceae bacterium]